ncbi:MAG: DUF962 domain-containing protein [Chitinophagales bacterium]
MAKKFNSLEDFYPFYLTEHSNFVCRSLHFIGTSIVITLFIVVIVTQKWWLMAFMPVAGYGFAWFGHFAFEKNKPAAFKQPLYSLASDFKMFWDIITFQLPNKLRAAQKIYKI